MTLPHEVPVGISASSCHPLLLSCFPAQTYSVCPQQVHGGHIGSPSPQTTYLYPCPFLPVSFQDPCMNVHYHFPAQVTPYPKTFPNPIEVLVFSPTISINGPPPYFPFPQDGTLGILVTSYFSSLYQSRPIHQQTLSQICSFSPTRSS